MNKGELLKPGNVVKIARADDKVEHRMMSVKRQDQLGDIIVPYLFQNEVHNFLNIIGEPSLEDNDGDARECRRQPVSRSAVLPPNS